MKKVPIIIFLNLVMYALIISFLYFFIKLTAGHYSNTLFFAGVLFASTAYFLVLKRFLFHLDTFRKIYLMTSLFTFIGLGILFFFLF